MPDESSAVLLNLGSHPNVQVYFLIFFFFYARPSLLNIEALNKTSLCLFLHLSQHFPEAEQHLEFP